VRATVIPNVAAFLVASMLLSLFSSARAEAAETRATPQFVTSDRCTDCHTEQSAEWAADAVATRFPDSQRRGAHFSAAFAAAWHGRSDPGTLDLLIEIASNRGLPGIVRASTLETLSGFASPEIADRTETLRRDSDPLVRASAILLQFPAPPATRMHRVTPLLQDALRSVRIEAIRGLLDLFAGGLLPESDPSAQSAMKEYQLALMDKADFPETQLTIAGMALSLRAFRAAESAFIEAVRMDPQLIDAWAMTARLRAAQGDGAGAEDALRKGLKFNPDNPPLVQLLHALNGSDQAK
jgi:hypothetical protein